MAKRRLAFGASTQPHPQLSRRQRHAAVHGDLHHRSDGPQCDGLGDDVAKLRSYELWEYGQHEDVGLGVHQAGKGGAHKGAVQRARRLVLHVRQRLRVAQQAVAQPRYIQTAGQQQRVERQRKVLQQQANAQRAHGYMHHAAQHNARHSRCS